MGVVTPVLAKQGLTAAPSVDTRNGLFCCGSQATQAVAHDLVDAPSVASLHLPVWSPGPLAVLILFTFTGAAGQDTGSLKFAVKPLPLPGASGLVMLDYFAYDSTSRRLWVPVANTGSVDVIDRPDPIAA